MLIIHFIHNMLFLWQVWEAADVLIKAALPLTTSDTKTVSEWISQMATLPQASNLATRILLLTLLFEVSPRKGKGDVPTPTSYPCLCSTFTWGGVGGSGLDFQAFEVMAIMFSYRIWIALYI